MILKFSVAKEGGDSHDYVFVALFQICHTSNNKLHQTRSFELAHNCLINSTFDEAEFNVKRRDYAVPSAILGRSLCIRKNTGLIIRCIRFLDSLLSNLKVTRISRSVVRDIVLCVCVMTVAFMSR